MNSLFHPFRPSMPVIPQVILKQTRYFSPVIIPFVPQLVIPIIPILEEKIYISDPQQSQICMITPLKQDSRILKLDERVNLVQPLKAKRPQLFSVQPSPRQDLPFRRQIQVDENSQSSGSKVQQRNSVQWTQPVQVQSMSGAKNHEKEFLRLYEKLVEKEKEISQLKQKIDQYPPQNDSGLNIDTDFRYQQDLQDRIVQELEERLRQAEQICHNEVERVMMEGQREIFQLKSQLKQQSDDNSPINKSDKKDPQINQFSINQQPQQLRDYGIPNENQEISTKNQQQQKESSSIKRSMDQISASKKQQQQIKQHQLQIKQRTQQKDESQQLKQELQQSVNESKQLTEESQQLQQELAYNQEELLQFQREYQLLQQEQKQLKDQNKDMREIQVVSEEQLLKYQDEIHQLMEELNQQKQETYFHKQQLNQTKKEQQQQNLEQRNKFIDELKSNQDNQSQLQKEINSLKQIIKQGKEENIALKSQIQLRDLQAEKLQQDLQAIDNELQIQRTKLFEQQQNSLLKNQKLVQEIDSINQANIITQEENTRLQQVIESLNQEIRILKATYQQIQKDFQSSSLNKEIESQSIIEGLNRRNQQQEYQSQQIIKELKQNIKQLQTDAQQMINEHGIEISDKTQQVQQSQLKHSTSQVYFIEEFQKQADLMESNQSVSQMQIDDLHYKLKTVSDLHQQTIQREDIGLQDIDDLNSKLRKVQDSLQQAIKREELGLQDNNNLNKQLLQSESAVQQLIQQIKDQDRLNQQQNLQHQSDKDQLQHEILDLDTLLHDKAGAMIELQNKLQDSSNQGQAKMVKLIGENSQLKIDREALQKNQDQLNIVTREQKREIEKLNVENLNIQETLNGCLNELDKFNILVRNLHLKEQQNLDTDEQRIKTIMMDVELYKNDNLAQLKKVKSLQEFIQGQTEQHEKLQGMYKVLIQSTQVERNSYNEYKQQYEDKLEQSSYNFEQLQELLNYQEQQLQEAKQRETQFQEFETLHLKTSQENQESMAQIDRLDYDLQGYKLENEELHKYTLAAKKSLSSQHQYLHELQDENATLKEQLNILQQDKEDFMQYHQEAINNTENQNKEMVELSLLLEETSQTSEQKGHETEKWIKHSKDIEREALLLQKQNDQLMNNETQMQERIQHLRSTEQEVNRLTLIVDDLNAQLERHKFYSRDIKSDDQKYENCATQLVIAYAEIEGLKRELKLTNTPYNQVGTIKTAHKKRFHQ